MIARPDPICERYGYRLREIADHVGVHYATVSRQLKKMEARNV